MNFFFEISFLCCKLRRLSLLLAEYLNLDLPIFDALGHEISSAKIQEILSILVLAFSLQVTIRKQSKNLLRMTKHALENYYYRIVLKFRNSRKGFLLSFIFSKKKKKRTEHCNLVFSLKHQLAVTSFSTLPPF